MKSKTVKLRSFTKDDISSYYDIAQDKSKYFPFGYCRTKKDAKITVDSFINSEDMDVLAIINEINELVGVIILQYQKNKVQLSYFIGIQYRRRGYCKNAIMIVEEIIKVKNINIIEFFIFKDNDPSILLAKGIGAKEVSDQPDKDFIIFQKNI